MTSRLGTRSIIWNACLHADSVHVAHETRRNGQPIKSGPIEIPAMTTVAIRWILVGHLARVPWIQAANAVMASQARDTRLASIQIIAMARLTVLRV